MACKASPPRNNCTAQILFITGGWLKRKSNDSMAKGAWLILLTPGFCDPSPARQRGPFKTCGALRKHGYFRSQQSPQRRFQGLMAVPLAAFSRLVE